jgi:hypothetical protein
MKSHIIALAALAAIGFSAAALAEDGPKAMTDAEMDGITAGVLAYQITVDLQTKSLDLHKEIIVPNVLGTAATASTGGGGESAPYGIGMVQTDQIDRLPCGSHCP